MKRILRSVKIFIFTSALLALAMVSFSQEPGSNFNIQELTDSIDKIVKEEKITGLMLGITTKDSVLFTGGFGYADLEAKVRVDDSSLFRMGSITKMFVSLGIMKLVTEGKLKLDDELRKIAPEVPFQNKWESTSPVRIVHLLEHTSAFDDIKLNRMYSLNDKENAGIDMMLVHKNSMVCRWKPGERFAYSNPNYAILGYIIQKLSGQPYDQYLSENILTPLGMRSSNFNLRSKNPRDVKEYIVKNGNTRQVNSVTLLSGAPGALWSNAIDMVKFLQLFLGNGEPLFPSNTIAEIETTHSSLAARAGQTNGYALGNDNTFFGYSKFAYRGHDGITGTCFSSLKYNRELGIGFVLASNNNNSNYRIANLIVSYFEKNKPAKSLTTQPLDIKAIKPFLGRYQFESPRNEISAFSDKLQNAPKIYLEGGKLFYKPLIGAGSELLQTGPLTFALRDMNLPLICFTKNDSGENVMMIGGSYFAQASNFWALAKRGIVIIALLIAFTSFISGFYALIGKLRRKLSWRDMFVAIIPMIGLSLLLWAISNLLEVQKYTYLLSELSSINTRTMIIFLGTTAFGLGSLASLFFSIRMIKTHRSSWIIYYLMVSISFCIIATILLLNGWIGLRTWAL